jgi:hypothetical protein
MVLFKRLQQVTAVHSTINSPPCFPLPCMATWRYCAVENFHHTYKVLSFWLCSLLAGGAGVPAAPHCWTESQGLPGPLHARWTNLRRRLHRSETAEASRQLAATGGQVRMQYDEIVVFEWCHGLQLS